MATARASARRAECATPIALSLWERAGVRVFSLRHRRHPDPAYGRSQGEATGIITAIARCRLLDPPRRITRPVIEWNFRGDRVMQNVVKRMMIGGVGLLATATALIAQAA